MVQAFKDKGVLITGAGRGIGKRLAIGFAHAGARVGLLARSKAELELADLEIEHGGGTSLRLRADVREYDQVAAAAERMRNLYGGVHVLVCAAGELGPIGPFAEVNPREWAEVLNVNLIGAMHAVRAVLPQMIERRSGKIILLTGGGAEEARPWFSAYAASKTALTRFAESLAEEVREDNVQINCMYPGPTYTNTTDELLRAGERAGWKEVQEASQVRTHGGTPPEKQINLAMFLASDRSNHISGKLLHVDDDWRRLEHATVHAGIYTLRRLNRG
ncbi:MAG: SDR family oxidoreductase [Bryobacteraceae bacterium]|nr:SDR family oxidoreductase [Bryobacteraceae bacterium]